MKFFRRWFKGDADREDQGRTESERESRDLDIIRLLKKIAGEKGGVEVVYVNSLLLDALFGQQFGGVSKLVQSVERTSDQALKSEAGAGLGGVLAKLFLDLKVSITAEGKIGEQTKTIVERELGIGAANVVRAHWKRDQSLTPNSPQVALATRKPFPMAAIVMMQPGLQGSTYIAYPPPAPAHRSVLAEPLFEDEGVTFLKTYWVVDKRSN
jgi:hypothetical protein